VIQTSRGGNNPTTEKERVCAIMATTTKDKTTEAEAPDEPVAEDAAEPTLPNKVTKVGNLTRSPELQFGKTGTAYARCSIAVNHPKIPGDWAGEQVTDFYDVTAFGSLGEHIAETLDKGDRVVVTGRPEVREWTDKEGVVQTSKGILADAVGVELRFATATVNRIKRGAPVSASTSEYEEEPF